jgi:hypothetical protein
MRHAAKRGFGPTLIPLRSRLGLSGTPEYFEFFRINRAAIVFLPIWRAFLPRSLRQFASAFPYYFTGGSRRERGVRALITFYI